MVEEDTGVGINIGPWVLDFTEFLEEGWNDVEDDLAELNEGVILDMTNCEFSLMDISWVSVSKHGMSVTWNDFTGSESSLSEFSDTTVGDVVS